MAEKQKPERGLVGEAARKLRKASSSVFDKRASGRLLADEKNDPKPHKPNPPRPKRKTKRTYKRSTTRR